MFNTIKVNNTDTNYTHSIFDISEYTGKKYDTLSDALTDVPDGKQSDGMTVRFVSTSDNTYVQYRLMSDTWSVDTADWSICSDNMLVINPEFIRVYTDKDDRILWAIKTDGTIYYGAGVPPQVISYINERIERLDNFLDGLEDGDETLLQLLNERGEYINNHEFIQIITDSEGKIIEATKRDGKKVFYGGIEGLPNYSELQQEVDGIDERVDSLESWKTTIDAHIKPELPDYYTNAWLKNIIDGINEQSSIEKGVSFVFFTDIHFGPWQPGNSKYLIKQILDKTSVPFTIFGGDIVWAYGTEDDLDEAISDFREYQEVIGKDRFFSVRGNHDVGITDNSVTPNVNYAKSIGFVNSLLSINNGWEHKALASHLCAVIENASEKVRILLLNSEDKQDDNYLWGCRHYVSAAQLKWIVNDVMSDEGYKYIVISHTPADSTLSYYDGSQANLHNLLLAVKNNLPFSCSVDDEDISKDFSNTTNDIMCHIMGHSHVDESHVDSNLLSITTTCDVCSGAGRVKGTLTEQAFDVFTVDIINAKLYAYRVGAGNNREWNLIYKNN